LLIDAGATTFGKVSVWTSESRALFQDGGDRKVVNFGQILFANGRMVYLSEAPAQRGRAVNSTF
jgi:hypothetical protein